MASNEPDPLIGKMIENRFEVASLLGRGGMAVVYMANHKQIDLKVAVKVLQPSLVEYESNIERFKREARMVNSLFHPNIIKMYSFGILETGQPYLVFEYIEGMSLGDHIDSSGPMPAETATDVFGQICSGVAYAHEQKVLHRDLKPSNIMLIADADNEETVKILDFGIARQVSPAGRDAQRLTGKSEIFGSPLYMSPEQCLGEEVDERSDVYSMGCLMYETLAGGVPFIGDNPFATMAQQLNKAPERFDKIGVVVPKKLEEIVFKALEKKPEDRYQTMAQIGSDLRTVV